MSRWFRHYAGMMRDDKLVRVALRAKQPIERVCWIWGAILESAAEIDDAGRYDLDAAEAAYFLRADEADVVGILRELDVAGRTAEGAVVKWGNRQFQSDRSAERVARHREKKRQGSVCDDRSNGGVTLQERPRNSPETETETKTEVSEANASSARAWILPAGVSLQVWTDFLSNRKRKRLGNTPTAWKSFNDDLARVSLKTGIPPPKLIEVAAAKGWGSINDPNERGHNGTQHQSSLRGSRPDPALDLLRAARAAEAAERTDGQDHRGTRPSLPAIGCG